MFALKDATAACEMTGDGERETHRKRLRYTGMRDEDRHYVN